MTCDLCHEPASRLHRVIVRPDEPRSWDEPDGTGGDRESFVCPACFEDLDNPLGTAEIGGRAFSLAGASRRHPSPT